VVNEDLNCLMRLRVILMANIDIYDMIVLDMQAVNIGLLVAYAVITRQAHA